MMEVHLHLTYHTAEEIAQKETELQADIEF